MAKSKRWVMLSLVLVPSVLAIGSFVIMRGHGADTATHSPAQIAKHRVNGTITMFAANGAPITATDDAALNRNVAHTSKHIAGDDNKEELKEEHPLLNAASIVDNYVAPAAKFDSFVTSEPPPHNQSDFVANMGAAYGWLSGGLIGSGGGSKSHNNDQHSNSDHSSNSNHSDSQGGSTSSASSSEGSTTTSSTSSSSSSSSSSSTSTPNDISTPIVDEGGESSSATSQVNVPEPSTLVLFGLGLIGLAAFRKQRA